MSGSGFSVLELLDFPPLERDIVLRLARSGSADLAALCTHTGKDPESVRAALDSLAVKGRIVRLAGDLFDVSLGRVAPKTTLPNHFWPALLSSGRLYTEQEIATLRTAIPMLQFARARLSNFSDHGPRHALRVKSFATQIGYILGLTETERFLLRASTLFHDIGNVVDRGTHHIISEATVVKLSNLGELPLDKGEAELIGLLCRWHRKEYEPDRVDSLNGETIRTGLLASILRVCDAMDIDQRRSDYDEKFRKVLEFFFKDQLPYWTSLEEILGLRIRIRSGIRIQVFTDGPLHENIQIDMLQKDLNSTPFTWQIDITPSASGARRSSSERSQGNALLVFPFDANALVMAAISRKHLRWAGHEVDLFCYPDTPGSPEWLWSEGIKDLDPKKFSRIVVIGDREGRPVDSALYRTVSRWQSAGTEVSILNRFEGNWSRLPILHEMGVDVVLGGDWAYFWGDHFEPVDLSWGLIAALCSRDPTQANTRVPESERSIVEGLLYTTYDVIRNRTLKDTAEWSALAVMVLDRIEADDRQYFRDLSPAFEQEYASPIHPHTSRGRVIYFSDPPGPLPQAHFWVLEKQIERYGTRLEQRVEFKQPYAVAAWEDGDAVELLAINHWRDEACIPVRFLYPNGRGPAPVGNESTVSVRLPKAVAEAVITDLIDACNREILATS